jgi:TRAP transporter TAXI family solute receptor
MMGVSMASRIVLAVTIAALVVFAAAGSYFAWKSNPWLFPTTQTLRVATMPLTPDGETYLTALKREIASERARVQLSLVETPSIWASGQAFKDEKVDAAVVRSDDPAAVGGRAIFILRTLYAVLLVPAQPLVGSISSLKGKKIGILADDAGIDPMAKAVMDFYGFDEKQIARLGLKDLPAALQNRQVAALLVVGPTGVGPIAAAIEAFNKVTKRPPKFLDLSEATAIAERFAVYDEGAISAGAFSGSPAVPSEKVTTISANVLLIARASLSNYSAGEITRLLLATKSRVAATLPDAGQLAAPSTDKDELLPAHPGTVAFLNGEQSNLLDESVNWILLGSMLTGLVGSLATWLNKARQKKREDELQGRIRRLPMLLEQARTSSPERLDATAKELGQLSQWLSQKFIENEISPEEFHNAEASVADIAALIQKKRASAPLDHQAGDRPAQLGEAQSFRPFDGVDKLAPFCPPEQQLGLPFAFAVVKRRRAGAA